MFSHRQFAFALVSISVVLAGFGCAGLKDLAAPQKPALSVANVRLANLSFDAADLMFDLKIDNPNPLGVTLAGFDYAFALNESSFLQGSQSDRQTIPAQGSGAVQVPIRLVFKDVFDAFSGLKNQDSTQYKVDFGFAFDVPVLGTVKVPISKAGFVPLLKLPKLRLGGVKLKKLNLTGADVQIDLQLDNPNAFSVNLKKLNYALNLGGQDIASGLSSRPMRIAKKKESTISLPISLNFLQAGRSLYNLLTNRNDLDYKLTGDFNFSTSMPVLGEVNLPIDQAGKIRLNR